MAISTMFELNDTLQLTKEQGFPSILDIHQHMISPVATDVVKGKTFTFVDKPRLRNYPVPPVRCFLVENTGDKWIYRGQCYITQVTHNYIEGTTSGTFTITKIFTPEEMKQAFQVIDSRPDMNYFI